MSTTPKIPHILLLGGHGKISQLLTPLLLAKSWNVTSVIRNPEHRDDILKLGEGQKGRVDVLVDSLEEVKSEGDAKRVLEKLRPDWVVWSAGAGGKGGPTRTFSIDRDACCHYIRACTSTPTISKFLLVSYIGSRRNRPHWWNDEDWHANNEVNNGALANYYKAKVESDELLTALAYRRREQRDRGSGGGAEGTMGTFEDIVLRPGRLTDVQGTAKVTLGHTRARGDVSRMDVARVAAELLEKGYHGWVDLLEGEEEVEKAVERVVREGTDCFEGEDKERVYAIQ